MHQSIIIRFFFFFIDPITTGASQLTRLIKINIYRRVKSKYVIKIRGATNSFECQQQQQQQRRRSVNTVYIIMTVYNEMYRMTYNQYIYNVEKRFIVNNNR